MSVPGTQLANDYAGNVVDLCPVGALTDKDFRFKRRVWYLKRAPSICTGCSRGCNIHVDWERERAYKAPERRIQRLKPRYNRLVNEWWLCDRGRYSYHRVDSPDRLLAPRAKAGSTGSPLMVAQVIERAAAKIKAAMSKQGGGAIAVLASPHSTNEDLFLLRRLFVESLRVDAIDIACGPEETGREDEILMRADLTPNRRGALALELGATVSGGSSGDDILKAAIEGEYDVLIVVGHDLTKTLSAKDLQKLDQRCDYILYLGTHENAFTAIADDVIPLAVWTEYDGTYANFQGRVQRAQQVFPPLQMAVPEWTVWRDLAGQLGFVWNYSTAADVFDAIGTQSSFFKGLTWEGLGFSGKMLTGVAEPPYRKVQSANPLPAY